MASCKICDKCKQIITPEMEDDADTRSWNTSYGSKIGISHPAIINKQKVAFLIRIYLECGDPLDLCSTCGWKLIKRYIK